MYRAICAPDLFAGVSVECRYELLFLVVVHDDNEVIHERGGRGGSEIEDRREAFERGVPDFGAIQIVGEKAKVIDVNVDSLAVRNGSLRAEAVLTMTASRRPA